MNAFDLFLLTSKIEGTPISMLEAMSCNTQILVPPVGGIPDIVKSKENLLSMNINKDVEKIKNLVKTPSNNRSYVLSNHKETDISYAFLKYIFFRNKEYVSIKQEDIILDGQYI